MEQGPAILTLVFLGLVVGIPVLAFFLRFGFFYVMLRMTPLEKRTGIKPSMAALVAAVGFGKFNK